MSNVISLSDHNHDRTRHFHPHSELYFKTWERPLTFPGTSIHERIPGYYRVDSHKAIVRMHPIEETKPIAIGIVGKNYKRLPTQDLCEAVEDTFIKAFSHEQLASVKRTDAQAYNGGTCIRNYIFPDISADIGSNKSSVAFRTVIINGYDGSSSFKFYSGAIDFFCSNGMVTGVFDLVTKRHTAGLQLPNFTSRLEKSIDIFYKQADQWKHWVGKEISDEDAKICFEAMPNVSERRVDQLVRQFRIESESHGRTVWALYSAATQYATHDQGSFAVRDTNSNHKAATLMHREQQVRSWTSTDEFMRIAA